MKYWLSPKISWKKFKKINEPFNKGIVPKEGDKILWKMLKDRQINIYLSSLDRDKDDPIVITTFEIKGGKIIS